jgi:hypothetical protein
MHTENQTGDGGAICCSSEVLLAYLLQAMAQACKWAAHRQEVLQQSKRLSQHNVCAPCFSSAQSNTNCSKASKMCGMVAPIPRKPTCVATRVHPSCSMFGCEPSEVLCVLSPAALPQKKFLGLGLAGEACVAAACRCQAPDGASTAAGCRGTASGSHRGGRRSSRWLHGERLTDF